MSGTSDDDDNINELGGKKVKTATDIQRIKLEKLMKDPVSKVYCSF
jgi:hypothetical protein